MTEFSGYPLVDCPQCGASDQVVIRAAVKPEREFGPGEWAIYCCEWCDVAWRAIVPEPRDERGLGGIPL